jgi:ABC-type transporter Mla subunit MlaD
MSNLKVGLIAALVLIPIVYLAFTKAVPFTHEYQIHAIFKSALNIAPKSPVRIAGVEVGRVTSVERYGDGAAAKVTMEIDKDGLPIHQDATLKIRPRLFLEGNFFIDLKPGTPSGANLPEDGTIPMSQTADPVQIDQVLSTLNQPTRTGLQQALDNYGGALTLTPTPALDLTQDELVQGKTAARALNDAARRGGPALKSISLVNQAMLGVDPKRDIPELIKGVGSATAQLGADERSLQDFVTSLDEVAGVFASQSHNLAQSVALLPTALHQTTAAFDGLTATLPAVETFANGFTDVAEQLPTTYRYFPTWAAATETLLGPTQFGGVAKDLKALAGPLAQLVPAQTTLTDLIGESAKCGDKVVLPTLATKLDDGALSTGQPNYQEFWRSAVGLGGSAQNFNGNGTFLRLLAGSGNTFVKTGQSSIDGVDHGQSAGSVYGGWSIEPPKGTSPAFPGVYPRLSQSVGGYQYPKEPPVQTAARCSTQKRPNVNGPLAHGPADTSGPRTS